MKSYLNELHSDLHNELVTKDDEDDRVQRVLTVVCRDSGTLIFASHDDPHENAQMLVAVGLGMTVEQSEH